MSENKLPAKALRAPTAVVRMIHNDEDWVRWSDYCALRDVQAASVEPVGSIDHVEWSASKEQWRHNIWADKKIPFGTQLYTHTPETLPSEVRELLEELTTDTTQDRAERIGQLLEKYS